MVGYASSAVSPSMWERDSEESSEPFSGSEEVVSEIIPSHSSAEIRTD